MSKLLFAKIWMGITYTALAAVLLTLLGALVWGFITYPEIARPITWIGCLVAVYLVFSGLAKLTMWANKTIEENK